MIMNQEQLPTYKPLFPVLRTQTASLRTFQIVFIDLA